MNKRLALLEKMAQSGAADSFARYALALEYKKEGQIGDALRAFQGLRSEDPDYLAQYLMAGQMLIEAGQTDEAREWLQAGLLVAQKQNDAKAQGELEAALADC